MIPVLRPRLPSAEQLLPYLRRIDATRIYTSWGPLALELEERLCRRFSLPVGGVVSASSGGVGGGGGNGEGARVVSGRDSRRMRHDEPGHPPVEGDRQRDASPWPLVPCFTCRAVTLGSYHVVHPASLKRYERSMSSMYIQ